MRGEAGEGRRLKQLNSSRLQEGAPCRSGSIFELAEYVHFRAVAHTGSPQSCRPRLRSGLQAVQGERYGSFMATPRTS